MELSCGGRWKTNQGHPLSVDFLTDRADKYRFHYSFPSFAQDIPEKLRDK
jgi:hypothetical protein